MKSIKLYEDSMSSTTFIDISDYEVCMNYISFYYFDCMNKKKVRVISNLKYMLEEYD